ncbi:MAG: DUF2950 domain-containing protein [Bryobacteraceae bacterium]
MSSRTQTNAGWKSQSTPLVIAILGALGLLAYAALESRQTPSAKAFATPNEAAQAFIQAANAEDVSALTEILGPDAKDLISSADHVRDKNRITEFAALAREKQSVSVDPEDTNTATLSVGDDDWPFPIPIVKRDSKWYYDAKAGREEILFRRVGENELDAIKICQGFVEAQKEYASAKHDGAEVNQYAQRVISTPGKQDGLAWQNTDGSWGGPVGETIANALAQGYNSKAEPFHGYFFKVLKGQGPAAPIGQMDFLVDGIMIGGFALAAAPAQYRVTGVQTFMVSHDGIVYQKDVGPETLTVFKTMDRYNPDKTWHPASDEE